MRIESATKPIRHLMAHTTRIGPTALSIVLLSILARPATAVVVDLSDINLSGGLVYGSSVVLPIGETVSIGVRISNPTLTSWHGIGLSYYGYDPALLGFVGGDAVDDFLHTICFPPSTCLGGGNNLVGGPLVETNVFPTVPLAGMPRVRTALFLSDYNPISGAGADDPGLDGVVGGQDAHFRVTFQGTSDGLTEVEIGTGDDRGGILLEVGGVVSQSQNATVRIAVPEPAFAWGLFLGSVGLGSVGLGSVGLGSIRMRSIRRVDD